MGCVGSKNAPPGVKYAVGNDEERVTAKRPTPTSRKASQAGSSGNLSRTTPTASGQIKSYTPQKAKLDPKDFQFVGLRDVCQVKPPGSINGQAFTIDNCQNCDLYVLDNCAAVNIDDCINCRIFIGPTTGSIFLRSSKDVKCAFITRQLRLRDVQGADLALLCRTQPIIEESTNVGLTCFNLNYPALIGQLQAAKLDLLHNFWWHVYDFTPKEGNYRYLPASTSTDSLLGGLPAEVAAALTSTSAEGELVRTLGPHELPEAGAAAGQQHQQHDQYLFAVFPPGKEDAVHQFLNQAKHQARVLTTNKVVVPADLLDAMKSKAGWPRAVERHLAGLALPCAGVELHGDVDTLKTLSAAAHMLGGEVTHNPEVGAMFRKLGLEGT